MTFTLKEIVAYLPSDISRSWVLSFLAPAQNGTRPAGTNGLENTYSSNAIDYSAELRRKRLSESQSRSAPTSLKRFEKRLKVIKKAIAKVEKCKK